MSDYSKPRKSSHNSNSRSQGEKGRDGKTYGAQSSSSKGSSSRFGKGSSAPQSRGGASGRGKRPIKSFDPSNFLKKVEETVPTPAYTPQHMFADFPLVDRLKSNILERGYQAPTPIQDQAIMPILEGKDLVGSANTGTGKTAAFLIPLVNRILTNQVRHALIIAPTRELAEQIKDELAIFKQHTHISSTVCIGGANMGLQIRALQRGPHVVIGTPGRLIDLEQQGEITFNLFDTIVLDEVDTMLNMGFIKDITYIIKRLPAKRHSLFFSATIAPEVKTIINSFLNSPVMVSVKSRQSAENVNQSVIKVEGRNKVELLHDLLIKPEVKKTIIFVRTKRAADKLSKMLIERGFKIATIHGDKSQPQRKKALGSFKNDEMNILLATDVVARGIDVDDVTHVINFDMPESHEDYIHRIGRTGRADKVGQAITFVD